MRHPDGYYEARAGDRYSRRTPRCGRCRIALNPVDAMLGRTCGKCARELHAEATGKDER